MNKKGFLLFEVIISIAIITAGLLYIAHSYSSSKNSIQKSEELIRSSSLLENKMWEFEEKGEIKEGPETGDFLEDEEYTWQINASCIEDSERNLVILKVFQKKDPQNTAYSISTYLRNKEE